METTLVDSNVLLDYFDQDSEWFDWSASMLSAAADRGRTAINPLIYAEVSVGFSSAPICPGKPDFSPVASFAITGGKAA